VLARDAVLGIVHRVAGGDVNGILQGDHEGVRQAGVGAVAVGTIMGTTLLENIGQQGRVWAANTSQGN